MNITTDEAKRALLDDLLATLGKITTYANNAADHAEHAYHLGALDVVTADRIRILHEAVHALMFPLIATVSAQKPETAPAQLTS